MVVDLIRPTGPQKVKDCQEAEKWSEFLVMTTA